MRKALFCLTSCWLGLAAHAQLSDTGVLLDRIVAIVNEGVVLESELDEHTRTVRRNLAGQDVALPPDDILRAQVLESLVLKRIQLQRAERLGISVSDEDVNRSLASVAERNGITLSQLPAALAVQGIDYAMFRDEARTEMILEQLRMRDVGSRITVSRGEVDQLLAQTGNQSQDFEVFHILIDVDADADQPTVAAAEAEAREIYERLAAGEDFGPIAIAYSDAPGVLQNRGSLGWRKADELPSLFAEKIATMSPGETAEPIRSSSGFHVIQLNDTRGAERIMTTQRLARHILIAPDEIVTEEAARNQIETIAARLAKGEDFAALAESHSDDSGSARQGGDLGWTSPGSFVPNFEEALGELQPGEISEPFRTQYGWHIVQLLDTRDYDSTLDMRRNQAARMLRSRKFEEETQSWLRRLRDEAYVEVRLGSGAS